MYRPPSPYALWDSLLVPDGKLGLWVERGTARFGQVRVAQVEALP